jgi:hypothetical protein
MAILTLIYGVGIAIAICIGIVYNVIKRIKK